MKLIEPRPDIFVLGFQEIVPLTAQQIVQTDPEKRQVHSLDNIVTRFLSFFVLGVFGKIKSWILLIDVRTRSVITSFSGVSKYVIQVTFRLSLFSFLSLVSWDSLISAGAFRTDSCHKKCRRNVKKGRLPLSCVAQYPQCYQIY